MRLIGDFNDGREQATALAAAGIQVDVEELADPDIELWPENELPVRLFGDMLTSWSMASMGGYIGLRYEVLPGLMRLHRVPRRNERFVLAAVKVMESAALVAMNSRKQ